jgi:hypothetical protein
MRSEAEALLGVICQHGRHNRNAEGVQQAKRGFGRQKFRLATWDTMKALRLLLPLACQDLRNW